MKKHSCSDFIRGIIWRRIWIRVGTRGVPSSRCRKLTIRNLSFLSQLHWYPCWNSVTVRNSSVSGPPVGCYWCRRRTDPKYCDIWCKKEIPVFETNFKESADPAFHQISFSVFTHPQKATLHSKVHVKGKFLFMSLLSYAGGPKVPWLWYLYDII